MIGLRHILVIFITPFSEKYFILILAMYNIIHTLQFFLRLVKITVELNVYKTYWACHGISDHKTEGFSLSQVKAVHSYIRLLRKL